MKRLIQNTRVLGVVILILGAVGLGLFVTVNADFLLDFATLFAVFGPVLITSPILFFYGLSVSRLWTAAGIPIATTASCIGFTMMLENMSDPASIQSATALALGTLFWGGLVSSLGVVFENTQPSATKEIKYNRILVTVMASIPLFFLILSANATNTLSSIFLIDSFLIVFSPALFYLGLVWYRGRILVSNELLQMIVVGVLGAVVVALVRYLNALDRHSDDLSPLLVGEAIAVGVLGILYGSFALSVAAFCSFSKTFRNVRFAKLNWHLLEVFALWILMVFAPLTVREYVISYVGST